MKILKRPMFRKGGEVGGGIMTGVMRENYQEGTPSARQRYQEIVQKYAQPAVDPVSQLLIQGGLRGMSQTGGGGLFGNLAMAFEPATAQFLENMQKQKDFERDTKLTGLEMDIAKEEKDLARKQVLEDTLAAQKFEEDMMKKKQAFQIDKIGVQSEADINELIKKYELEDQYKDVTSKDNLQKDFSPQRAYETAVSERIKSAASLRSSSPFAKLDINQKYPRATAEYDVFVLRNLRATDDPAGQKIASANMGFVPYNPKDETFDYNKMITGGYYYDPRQRSFVTRRTSDDGDQFFIVNPYTFEESLIER